MSSVLESTGDYLSKKASQLGLDRQRALEGIQAVLEQEFPGYTKALSLNNQVLKVITPSSAVASELRLRQVELLTKFRAAASGQAITNLHIQIRGL